MHRSRKKDFPDPNVTKDDREPIYNTGSVPEKDIKEWLLKVRRYYDNLDTYIS